jgi:hypothetical protein
VRDEGHRFVRLDDCCGGKDVLEFFKAHLTALRKAFAHDEENKKLLRVSEYKERDRMLEGIIETGEYGYESNLYDLKERRVSYNRRAYEAEMLPFYFLLHIPTGADEGILVLQRFKQYGIRKIFAEAFRAFFDEKCPDCRVAISPLVPEELVKQLVRKGRITKIRFVRFGIPDDLADAYDKGGQVEEGGRLELVVAAKRKGHIPIRHRLDQFLGNRRELTKLVELQHFDYENVKLEVSFEGTHRTVDLSNLHRLRAYYDVSSRVTFGSGGHPTFESVSGLGLDLLHDLNSAIRKGEP